MFLRSLRGRRVEKLLAQKSNKRGDGVAKSTALGAPIPY